MEGLDLMFEAINSNIDPRLVFFAKAASVALAMQSEHPAEPPTHKPHRIAFELRPEL